MSRRLTTDAKIVLERAGYNCVRTTSNLNIYDHPAKTYFVLPITDGTVNNDEVVKLLATRGYNEFGHPIEEK